MRVVVTGADGLLGATMVRELAAAGDVVGLGRRALDVTDRGAIARAFAEQRPSAVINCAVHNGVDGSEDDPVPAFELNAFAVRDLARASAAAGATFIHFSSDFVFDGQTDRPYGEDDRPNPQSIYGASKLLGDFFALEAGASVLRVESLFGPRSPSQTRRGSVGTIVDRIMSGDDVPVFVDRVVSPTYTPDIARAVRVLLDRQLPPGLYHCVNTGHATWEEIAAYAAALLDVPFRPRPMTLETAGLRARRPRYCALSNAKLVAAGCGMPTWQEALRTFLSTDRPV